VAPLAIRLSAEGGLRDRSIAVVVGEAGLASLDALERELAIVL